MKTITYNLNLENQEDYYLRVRKLTTYIINESKIAMGNVISDYQRFLCENPPQNLYINEDFKKNYNYEEHVFELLLIGIMWNNYIDIAINLDPSYQNIIAKLVDLRNEIKILNLKNNEIDLKEKIDEIRGFLISKHLLTKDIENIVNNNKYYQNKDTKNIHNNKYNHNNKHCQKEHMKNTFTENEKYGNISYNSNSIENNINFNIKNFNLLLNYLKATGDFEESVKHLFNWKLFFKENQGKLDCYFKNILSFTNCFYEIANEQLHDYLPNLANFRENQLQNHLNNENILFCGKDKSEYYLSMVGAEIMNRVFRCEFKKRERIAIILPNCMKIEDNSSKHNKKKNVYNNTDKNMTYRCMAILDHLGEKCTCCNEKCNIGRVNKVILKEYPNNNINLYISAHNSTIISNITQENKKELAIVGVACINNLIEGGWKISSTGIPAQCVILNYVGCVKHWNNKHIPTNFNLDELKRILTQN